MGHIKSAQRHTKKGSQLPFFTQKVNVTQYSRSSLVNHDSSQDSILLFVSNSFPFPSPPTHVLLLSFLQSQVWMHHYWWKCACYFSHRYPDYPDYHTLHTMKTLTFTGFTPLWDRFLSSRPLVPFFDFLFSLFRFHFSAILSESCVSWCSYFLYSLQELCILL